MNSIKLFYNKTLKYDLINKFLYKKTKSLPKLKQITLQLDTSDTHIKNLSSNLLALQ